MKSKTFKHSDMGSYVTAFKRPGEDWIFDFNFFDGERTYAQLAKLSELMSEAIVWAVKQDKK